MSLYANLRKQATPCPVPALQGQWLNIRLIPDLNTGEVLNLGVGLRIDGQVYAKLLSDFSRLRGLYGERFDPEALDVLIELTRLQVTLGDWPPRSPSPNIVFSAPKYAAGDSVEAILDDLYAVTVSLEPSRPDQHATGDDHG